jgi:hypothetical protein
MGEFRSIIDLSNFQKSSKQVPASGVNQGHSTVFLVAAKSRTVARFIPLLQAEVSKRFYSLKANGSNCG